MTGENIVRVKSKFLVFVILASGQFLRGSDGLQSYHYGDLPKVTISEVYGNPYYENIRPLSIQRSGEILVGENTSKGIKKLLFECSANYPIQWVYAGDGAPQYTTDSNIRRNSINSGDFAASLTISQLTSAHTGNYSCQGVQEPESSVSYHLFVPGGEDLFPSGRNDSISQIEFSNRDLVVRIPCGVTHPAARVTLQKVQNGFLNCPLNDSLSYDPKAGFLLRVNDFRDPSGIYVCTATHNEIIRVVQFRLLKRYDSIRESSNCHPSPCGRNAECTFHNGRTACHCKPGFNYGDPFSECRRLATGPENRVTTENGDACSNFPCGKYGECLVRNNLAVCQCPEGYLGKPPHCMPGTGPVAPGGGAVKTRCITTNDCSASELCVERRCTSQCEKRCGLNAACRIVNRTPICDCAVNYSGDPYRHCYPIESFSSPSNYEQQEERLRPECQIDIECPLELACIHQKCQSPCGRSCGPRPCHVRNHKAYCSCAPGDFQCTRFSTGVVEPLTNFGGCQRMNCGPNSQCLDGPSGRATCSCLPNHTGAPPNCAKTCFGNSGCPENQFCISRKCTDPCEKLKCGANAKCTVKKETRQATCECLEGHIGDPKIRCSAVPGNLLNPVCHLRCGQGQRCEVSNGSPRCKCINPFDTECQESLRQEANTRENTREHAGLNAQPCFGDSECPSFQGCFNGKCLDPCAFFETLCGENQECQAVNRKAACVCKKEFPVRINNDCYRERDFDGTGRSKGGNKESVEDFSDRRDDGAISYCEPPFCRVGDAGQEHHRCRFSGDCPTTKTCVNSKCVDMCEGACGLFATCTLIRRAPRCSCPPGYFGSPKIRCFPLRHVKTGGGSGQDGQEVILLSNQNLETSHNETLATLLSANSNSTDDPDKLSDSDSDSDSDSKTNSTLKSGDSSRETFGGVSASKILQLAAALNGTTSQQ